MELDKLETGSDIEKLIALREQITDLGESLEHVGDNHRPKMDLRNLGNAFELVVEVPGVSQRDLEVALQGRRLVVAGRREPHEDDAEVLLSERVAGPFQRSVELPDEVNREKCSAHLREGLLIVYLPKA